MFVGLGVALASLIVAAVRGRHVGPAQALPEEYLPVVPQPARAGEDLLVYWVDEPAPEHGPLPEGAELVGSVRSGADALEPPPGKAKLRYSLLEGRLRPEPSDPGDGR